MLDLGFRTHDFGRKFASAAELGEIAASYRKDACLHFAPYKVLSDVPKPFTPEWAVKTREELNRSGVRVAILGVYINPVHPQADALESELARFENGLEIAQALGDPLVATETGSLDVRNIRCEETWSDANWSKFLRTMERLLNKAVKCNATIAIEAVADKNTIDGPERMLRLMETFKSPNLRCLFDAVNIMPVKGVDDFEAYYDNAVSMLAPYISAMHLKDFRWSEVALERYPTSRPPVKNGTYPIGEGLMPWKTLFGIYRKYRVDNVPMTLENFNPETLERSLRFIDDAYAKA